MSSRKQGKRAYVDADTILRVSCQLIARHGLIATSFQRIADKVGVSQSTVMHYFPSKRILVERLIEFIVMSNHHYVSQDLAISDHAIDKLYKHIRANHKWAQEQGNQTSVILLLYYLGSIDKAFAKIYRTTLAAGRNRILEYVLAIHREQGGKIRLTEIQVAEMIHDCLMASLINDRSTQQTSDTLRSTLDKARVILMTSGLLSAKRTCLFNR